GIPDIFEGEDGGFDLTDANENGIPDIFESPNEEPGGDDSGSDLADENGNGIPDIFENPNGVDMNNCLDSLLSLLGPNGEGWDEFEWNWPSWNNWQAFDLDFWDDCSLSGGSDEGDNNTGNGSDDDGNNEDDDDGESDDDGDDSSGGGGIAIAGGSFMIEQGYPNPTSGMVNLGIRSTTASVIWIDVYSQFGQLVSSRQVQIAEGYNPLQFDLMSAQAQGIYHVQVRNNSQRETIQFVKE
ncbi:MAG: T9SS type A sorting domain-containing protein, partial [Crocinitomicaceae bacterium]|nr:T9SS type A sorting domain-containing protein [Crocinitomicaceae bacterium]